MKIRTFILMFCLVFNSAGYVSADSNQPPSYDERSELVRILFKEIGSLDTQSLKEVHTFISAVKEVRASNKVIEVKVKRPTFTVEEAVKGNLKLKKVSSQLEVVKLPSRRVQGVQNVYLKVSGKLIKNPDIFSWMPSKEAWGKYVDPQLAGILTDNEGKTRSAAQQYIALIYEGNSMANKDLIEPVEKAGFDWAEMPHPSNTEAGFMLIPVATAESSEDELLAEK